MNTLEKVLKNKESIYSSMVETIASRLYDVRKEGIKDSLSGFRNTAHRLEEVANVRGISFINDSKATNVNATWYALESMHRPVIWIAGGQDPQNDYNVLAGLVHQKVRALVCLGTENSNIIGYFKDKTDLVLETTDMMNAVQAAYNLGHPGDVVLLSPACPSFDLFDNYAERGKRFREAISGL